MIVMAAGFALLTFTSSDSFVVLAIAQVVLGTGSGLAGPRRSPRRRPTGRSAPP
ncbi:hypothetical protein ACFXJ8_41795 [Nonomuraea sp. NPDC059194]|uniref:hypothetical protein n=1 Tax=Nonomuraea sp. NPDC059194 TaxID=3346764 RepID=UPI003681F905